MDPVAKLTSTRVFYTILHSRDKDPSNYREMQDIEIFKRFILISKWSIIRSATGSAKTQNTRRRCHVVARYKYTVGNQNAMLFSTRKS